MFGEVSEKTLEEFKSWRKKENNKVRRQQKKDIAYYGAIGGDVEFIFYSHLLDAKAVNQITKNIFRFQYLKIPDLAEIGLSFQEKFNLWKQDDHKYEFRICSTSLGIGFFVQDLTSGDELDLNDYENW